MDAAYIAALARAAAAAFPPEELARMRADAETHDRRARERRARLRGSLRAVSVRGRDVVVTDMGTGEVFHAVPDVGTVVDAVCVRCTSAAEPLRVTWRRDAAGFDAGVMTRHACRSVGDVTAFMSEVLLSPDAPAMKEVRVVVLPDDG